MNFDVSGDAYDRFMGRYSLQLAPAFADFAGVEAGQRVVDVGGADPSPMLEACAERVPGADLRQASAEELPWPDDSFDEALAQLVVHFMDHPAKGVDEMARVTRAGGVVSACTWDFAGGGMKLLGTFWQSVRALDPGAESEISPFGDRGRLDALWRERGLQEVETEALEVSTDYEDFDEL